MSVVSPFFKQRGVLSPDFHVFGYCPLRMMLLNSLFRDGATPLAVSFRILGEIPSHPVALLTLSILSSLSPALIHISWKSK